MTLRPEHEALLHDALDEALTPEGRERHRQLLTHDVEAKDRAAELDQITTLLASLGPAEAPPQLVTDVLAGVSPHPAALQPGRSLHPAMHEPHRGGPVPRSTPKKGVTVNKKIIFGLAAAAVVVLAVITYTSYPPATVGTEATIGAAQRAQTPQIASKDVGLGDTSAQAVLQTDTWDQIMRDRELRNLLQDASFRAHLMDAQLRQALRNEAVVNALRDPNLASRLQDQALIRSLNDAALINRLEDANLRNALSNEAFLRALRNDNLRAYLSQPGTAAALSRQAFQNALSDNNFASALRSAQFEAALRSGTQNY